MHGTERRVKKCCASRRSAPLGPISLPQDRCFPARRSLSPQRSRPLVTAFPSPAIAAPSQRLPFRGQRSRPATSRPAGLFPRPVRPSAPLPSPVCPDGWQLHRFWPVAALLAGSTDCFPCLRSPSRVLPPWGSKRSTGSAATRLAFRTRPISSRSPQPVLFLGLATDHRSWLATFPEACCSSNLLEPHSL